MLVSPSELSDDESLVLPLVLAVAMIASLVGLLLTASLGTHRERRHPDRETPLRWRALEAPEVAAAQPRRKWAPVTRHHLAVCRGDDEGPRAGPEECRRLMDEERGPPAALVLLAAQRSWRTRPVSGDAGDGEESMRRCRRRIRWVR